MSRQIKAVIFDMDGVITNTMPYHYRVWKTLFHSEGLPVSKYEIYSREGQKGLVSVLEIFSRYGKTITRARAEELLARKEVLFKKIARKRFISGARTFIKKCSRQGFRLALVTGTSRDEVGRVLPADLLGRFEVVVTGNDVRNGKPHPEPYLKALKALKIRKEEAVVLENAPFGISSAKSAGIVCFALRTSLPASYLKNADRSFEGYPQLDRYFDHYVAQKS